MDQTNYPPVQKRSSSGRVFWGIFISILVIALIFTSISFLFLAKVISSSGGSDRRYEVERRGKSNEKIAVVDLDFTILESGPFNEQIRKYREDKSIKAIIIRMNTPGGGVAASQEMYEEVKKTRESGKPVVISIGSIGASGGYYVACAGNTIIANSGSLVGSIGVIISIINIKDLAEKLGIDDLTIKSGNLKDAGNPFREANEKDKEYFQDLVNNTFDQFLDVVARERNLDKEYLLPYANGRVFTGEQSKNIGLIDKVGTFDDAIATASEMAGIEGEPTIVKEKKRTSLIERILDSFTRSEIKDIKDEIKNEYLNQPILQYKYVH
jgi:protease IV